MKLSESSSKLIKTSAITLILSFWSLAYDVLAQDPFTEKWQKEILAQDKNRKNFEYILWKVTVDNIENIVNEFWNKLSSKNTNLDLLKIITKNKFDLMSKIFLNNDKSKDIIKCFNFFEKNFKNSLTKKELEIYNNNVQNISESIK